MDNITVLSWNVRGLNARARRDAVRTLVDDIRPSIMCLQETKLDVIPHTMVLSMLGIAFSEFAYLPASETRGGILITGRQPDVTISEDDGDKALFLEELEAIRDACHEPWALTGDFNLILNEADKSNDRVDRASLRRFRRTVAALELQDLHLHGRCYTWSNERANPTLVRLDRVLVSLDWDTLFPNAHLRGLGSETSDHCATNLAQMSKPRFHFEVFWPKFEDYDEFIAQTWKRPTVACDPLARLDLMLRNLVRQLQSW